MIPGSATHIDKEGDFYSITEDFVMLWQPDSKTWRCLAFEPDEVVKYLELHELKAFNEWREGL